MAPRRRLIFPKKNNKMVELQIFLNRFTRLLLAFLGIKTERDKKNPVCCHSSRSSGQNEISNVLIALIDFCQTCQPGSKMSF